jgi:N-acetylglucosaminyldiphosphoundecaprenol N-acetyl-beta-D-mannosaminyltransferase
MNRHSIDILGCPIDPVSVDGALEWCLHTCQSDGPARILVTANASHVVEMQHNADLRMVCLMADLIVADGMSIVWAGKFLGHSIPERVTGVDLLSSLLRAGHQNGLRIYFLGAKRDVIERFVRVTRRRYPGVTIAGFRDGYFSSSEHEQVIRDIAASQADILVVGMPSPFKDVWCQQHRDQFRVKLIIGVGGSLDVLAGDTKRAPQWLQKSGLEWAWRLSLEPRRLWRRYLIGNSRFIYLLLIGYKGSSR